MSAIAGITGTAIKKDRLERTLEPIRHRGPDRSMFKQLPNGGVAAGELELSTRSTPALSGDSEPAVLLDGEIYNTLADGQSNVEYIREQYQKFGKSCFSHLESSFACEIIERNETSLARDAVGARPIIYHQQNGRVSFASEVKSLIPITDGVEKLRPGTCIRFHTVSSHSHPMFPKFPRSTHPKKRRTFWKP